MISWWKIKMMKMIYIIRFIFSLIIRFATLLFNSHLIMIKWWLYWKIFLMNHRNFMIARYFFVNLYRSNDEIWSKMRKLNGFIWLSMMSERLVKKRKKLSVEIKDFSNIIKLLMFININIDDIAFSASQELDVKSWNIIAINDDSDALS